MNRFFHLPLLRSRGRFFVTRRWKGNIRTVSCNSDASGSGECCKSVFNREICMCGYLTQLGLFHSNTFNRFNLSCDLMEPFRVLVDREVYKNKVTVFDKEEKYKLLRILNDMIYIAESTQTVLNGIKIYCHSVFDALNEGDASKIKFFKLI